MQKNKYVNQKNILFYLKDLIGYIELNIVVYKNDINKILNNYIIMQNIKNAKYTKIIIKNNNINQFDKEIIKKYIYNDKIKSELIDYFDNVGKTNFNEESLKFNYIKNSITGAISQTEQDIKTKGNLYFKLWLCIGIIITIVLW